MLARSDHPVPQSQGYSSGQRDAMAGHLAAVLRQLLPSPGVQTKLPPGKSVRDPGSARSQADGQEDGGGDVRRILQCCDWVKDCLSKKGRVIKFSEPFLKEEIVIYSYYEHNIPDKWWCSEENGYQVHTAFCNLLNPLVECNWVHPNVQSWMLSTENTHPVSSWLSWLGRDDGFRWIMQLATDKKKKKDTSQSRWGRTAILEAYASTARVKENDVVLFYFLQTQKVQSWAQLFRFMAAYGELRGDTLSCHPPIY